MTRIDLGWVPADACTLPSAAQPLRLAEFDALFSASLRDVERIAPDRLLLVLDESAEEQVRDLVARESTCCSFFAFDVRREAGRIVLAIGVPESRVAVLDGLAMRATETGG